VSRLELLSPVAVDIVGLHICQDSLEPVRARLLTQGGVLLEELTFPGTPEPTSLRADFGRSVTLSPDTTYYIETDLESVAAVPVTR